ncbi:MAG: hypothetical protein WC459_03375 [Patescibacteria group bacterium]
MSIGWVIGGYVICVLLIIGYVVWFVRSRNRALVRRAMQKVAFFEMDFTFYKGIEPLLNDLRARFGDDDPVAAYYQHEIDECLKAKDEAEKELKDIKEKWFMRIFGW